MIQIQSIPDRQNQYFARSSPPYFILSSQRDESYKPAFAARSEVRMPTHISKSYKAAKKDLIYRPYPSRSFVDQDYVEKIVLSVSYLGLKIEFSLPDGPYLNVSSEKILFKYPSGIFL